MNLPNLLTVLRIAFVPLFVFLIFATPNSWFAVSLFVLAIATDGVDGAVARRMNLITNLGKLLDPIADKALLGAALISLSVLDRVPWWVTVVILLREVGITAYRLTVAKRRVIAAAGGGKLKTILQSVAVGFLLSPLDNYFSWLWIAEKVLLYCALVITLTSGLQFISAEVKARYAN